MGLPPRSQRPGQLTSAEGSDPEWPSGLCTNLMVLAIWAGWRRNVFLLLRPFSLLCGNSAGLSPWGHEGDVKLLESGDQSGQRRAMHLRSSFGSDPGVALLLGPLVPNPYRAVPTSCSGP